MELGKVRAVLSGPIPMVSSEACQGSSSLLATIYSEVALFSPVHSLPASSQGRIHPGRPAEDFLKATAPSSRLLWLLTACRQWECSAVPCGGSPGLEEASWHLCSHIKFENNLLPTIRSSASSLTGKILSTSAGCHTVLQPQDKAQPSCLSFPFCKIRVIVVDTSRGRGFREINELFVKCFEYEYCYG